MGAVGALESFWASLMLAVMDTEVVVLAEGGTALLALIGARGPVLGVTKHVAS